MERKTGLTYGLIIAVSCIAVALWSMPAAAQQNKDTAKVSVDLAPAVFVNVNGDRAAFSAQHWMSDGFSTGIEGASYKKTFKDGSTVSFKGHSIPNENDNNGVLTYTKENLGTLEITYQSFRQYFDTKGGTYAPFTTLSSNTEQNEDHLFLNLSNFKMDFNVVSDRFPDLEFIYEHHAKNGTKSLLTWSAVKSSTDSGTSTRMIGPADEEVAQNTDDLIVKGHTKFAGFNVKAKQKYEVYNAQYYRQEVSLDGTSSASSSSNRIRTQLQSPKSSSWTTTLLGDKWFNNDKSYTSLAYRFNKVDNTEQETISEFDQYFNPVCYSYCENHPNAWAANHYTTHTWTNMFMTDLAKNLNFTTKLKAEDIHRAGYSVYPSDSNLNGIADTYENSNVEEKTYNFGENVSLKYTGLPLTALYVQGEFEQSRDWQTQALLEVSGENAGNPDDNSGREDIAHVQNSVLTAGMSMYPFRTVTLLAQVRKTLNDTNYNNLYTTVAPSSSQLAFLDQLKINSDEFDGNVTWTPFLWLRNSFRYQLLAQRYMPKAVGEDYQTKSDVTSNIFTYDLALQPMAKLLLNTSLSLQEFRVATPAAFSTSGTTIPASNSNVRSALVGASYMFDNTKSFYGSFDYSVANNFNDYSSTGMPYGADFTMSDVTLGMKWKTTKNVTLQPHYSYYTYDPNPLWDAGGGYSASVVWLDAKFTW